MGENFKAATTFRKSYLLLKENKKLFPDFDYNDIFLGVEEAVVGTVPDDYRWIATVFGMKGDVKRGVAKVDASVSYTHLDVYKRQGERIKEQKKRTCYAFCLR